MDGAHIGSAAAGGMLTADRVWVRWGVTAAVTGMLAWVVAVALIPLDAKLDTGSQHLAGRLQVEIAPPQRGCLTPSQTRKGGQEHERQGSAPIEEDGEGSRTPLESPGDHA